MAELYRPISFEDFPSHLVLEILTLGWLSASDLVSLELTSKTFGGGRGLHPHKIRSLVDFAAFQLCKSSPVYARLARTAQNELHERCGGKWKRVLRFLQAVEQSSDMVETSAGNQMQITTGRSHTILINDSSVYSCGFSLCGALGHGPETTQCVALKKINFPYPARIVHVSASHNHAAFVMQSGEVFTCGDNSSFCCGHSDTSGPIFRPRLVEALKGVPCKQVATGFNFTAFLTKQGHVYTCGTNTHGQLGHGDTIDGSTPRIIELLEGVGSVAQIACGPSYALAVMEDGTVYSFGSAANSSLGHGELQNELHPRAIKTFRRKGIHILRVSAGDDHAVALDSNGYVYTWGDGRFGALGHGQEIGKSTPEILNSLGGHLAVQVCARKRKTFVLADTGAVYGFGWMGFGSLEFLIKKGVSDKVLKPRILDSLQGVRISQISAGLYHTVAVTGNGQIFGFGDNKRSQLCHEMLRECLQPTEISIGQLEDDPEN